MTKAHPLLDDYHTQRRFRLEIWLQHREAHAQVSGTPMTRDEFNRRLDRIHARYPIYDRSFELRVRAQLLLGQGAIREEVARSIAEAAKRKELRDQRSKVQKHAAVNRVETTEARNQAMYDYYLDLVKADPFRDKDEMYAECGKKFNRAAGTAANIIQGMSKK